MSLPGTLNSAVAGGKQKNCLPGINAVYTRSGTVGAEDHGSAALRDALEAGSTLRAAYDRFGVL
jgi:hypothetical protein